MFWEFFTFELRFRLKSISTYVYFVTWVLFAFLSVASTNASRQADCINPGMLDTNMRCYTRAWFMEMPKDCGRLARTGAIRASNCTPR